MNEPDAIESNLAFLDGSTVPMEPARPTLFARNLSKRFGRRTAVHMSESSLTLRRGERLGIIGPNGSGKTTLLHLMLRLHRPTDGYVELLGESICWPGQVGPFNQNKAVGVVWEDDGLYPDISGIGNLEIFARQLGIKEARRRIAECWLQMKLPDEAKHRKVASYSKGMRQRVALARAVLNHPKILLLDDPTAALDVSGWRELIGLLNQLSEEGTTLVICSHNLTDFLEHTCDHILLVKDGECVGPIDVVRGRLREQVERLLDDGIQSKGESDEHCQLEPNVF